MGGRKKKKKKVEELNGHFSKKIYIWPISTWKDAHHYSKGNESQNHRQYNTLHLLGLADNK